MDGSLKDLAEINALSTASAERLREHHMDVVAHAGQQTDVQGHEKTLAGLAIGSSLDLIFGKGATSQARVERANKADEYAEIAADTFASIPKFSAVTGGIARSVLLINVSGQSTAGEIAKGMACNFLQGAALNGVSRMASSESFLGKMVSNRLGAGMAAEVVTHGISGGGFGLVKSGMSGRSWTDAQGNFSLSTGLKNVATSTSIGTLIGVPAGMAGLRVGRAVTLGLGSQVEHSALASTVQKFATGAGSGFASGSVFGGVDAAKSGKSMSQIMDSTWQGGMVGLFTGGFSSGFDHTAARGLTTGGDHIGSGQNAELAGRVAPQRESAGTPRDIGELSLTQKIVDRSGYLFAPGTMNEAHDKLSYRPEPRARIENFAGRLSAPVIEERLQPTLKDNAPKDFDEYKAALKSLRKGKEELVYGRHFDTPFVTWANASMRVYTVEGHSTRIVVPENYAGQLDQVRALRKIVEAPSAFDRLSQAQKFQIGKSMLKGDATPLAEFMNPQEITQYIKVVNAAEQLRRHPLANRALPEDLVPILDALPNRSLLREVVLSGAPNIQDMFHAMTYDSPGFVAAATVGKDNYSVTVNRANYGTALYNTMFHEWAHAAKWKSPQLSKMYDLATVVDNVGPNIDHRATAAVHATDPTHEPILAPGLFHPNLHSTHDQDEGFATGLGEVMMGPDPNQLFSYLDRAPVRGIALATALEAQVKAAPQTSESTLADTMRQRGEYATEAVRAYALGTVQAKLTAGTRPQRAAAAQLMGLFGTTEQGPELLAVAGDKRNSFVPKWESTAAAEAMAGDRRSVAQHAFDVYLNLMHPTAVARFDDAMSIMLKKPELGAVAADYIARSADPRLERFGPLAKMYKANGTLAQRAAGIELIKNFGGEDKADQLLTMALDRDNNRVPNFRDTDIMPAVAGNHRTVSQLAYDAYIDSFAQQPEERYQFALKQGLERMTQRELAAQYLQRNWNDRARGFGQFLEMYDMPGHVSKMQELITGNFRRDLASQKMVFDRMMSLTDADPRRQMELIRENLLEVPTLMDSALGKYESILNRPTTRQQREEIDYAVSQRMRRKNYGEDVQDRMLELVNRVASENKLQDALTVVSKGHGDRVVSAVHELRILHDQRAIKPLIQQAVNGNGAVQQEAIGALRQFNPALVRFYAQELKRECFANPVMTGRITDLMGSGRTSPIEISSTMH